MVAKRGGKVNIAIVGTGAMGGCHARNYAAVRGAKLVACFDLDIERAKSFAAERNIPAVYDDLDALLAHPGLDAISNVTPDAAHARVAIAAAKAGKHILSEKPLATSIEDGRRMLAAVRKAGVVNMVNFTYRDSPALQEVAARIRRGDIGRVMHVESSYLQSWLTQKAWGDWHTEPSWLWRLSTKHGSFGALGDIGCHIYDTTCFLVGPIKNISCRLKCFPKGVKGNRIGKYRLDANDAFVSQVEFKDGALGVIHSTRWASGYHNQLRYGIYGDEGGIELSIGIGDWDCYRICRGRKNLESQNWQDVKARRVPNRYQRFVDAIRKGGEYESDFKNGLQVQKYLYYSVVSDEQQKSVTVR